MDTEIKVHTEKEIELSVISTVHLRRTGVLAKVLLMLILAQLVILLMFDFFLTSANVPSVGQYLVIVFLSLINLNLSYVALCFLLLILVVIYVCYLLYRFSSSLELALKARNSEKLEHSFGNLSRIIVIITSSILGIIMTVFLTYIIMK
ncbi:hypothetical protein LNQ81_03295 [Myroides sp. M-43]|uniref:hypothetical protein n=1 Tax=Myroides oncorhynchi TaxID=2893756 RepID=UPI001E2D2440|nr:hypothetical protein [Myroides oncorhynchi]MCC9041726.1 hypothetical protein [Myroides oncorhynchi]